MNCKAGCKAEDINYNLINSIDLSDYFTVNTLFTFIKKSHVDHVDKKEK